jgi:hypothetical protein
MRIAMLLLALMLGCKGGEDDADGDGYTAADDCDDDDPLVHPANTEACDGVDQDCDGNIDEDVAFTVFADADADGYGDPDAVTQACDVGDGQTRTPGDCDDADAAVSPDAVETCNGLDDDCDEAIDEDATDPSTWFADADGDGYGAGASILACDAPSGAVATSGDCDDGDATVNPGASEVCDDADVDEDCDGTADDADADVVGATHWHADVDGDGYGDDGDIGVASCDAPVGYAADATDCDDAKAAVHPGGQERCDVANADEDCDGVADNADPSATGKIPFFADADGDGFGDQVSSTQACDAPAGFTLDSQDCDDAHASAHPGGVEVCDPADVDEDCDGDVDDGDVSVTGRTPWYQDADRDGYGGASGAVQACDAPAGRIADGTDCDDTDVSISPGMPELCDPADVDEDCSGAADDADPNAAGRTLVYVDADGDGFGDAQDPGTALCDVPTGYVLAGADCDDTDAAYHPGAPESCSTNVDYNCDGSTGFTDGDGDGSPACADCDDADASAYPGAQEVCDAGLVDEDCDGVADDADPDATGKTAWTTDVDGDGYGDDATLRMACDAGLREIAIGGDCDDAATAVHPGAQEICDPANVDEDCDSTADDADPSAVGQVTVWTDADNDGYGDPASPSTVCDPLPADVANALDCGPNDWGINPSAIEDCSPAATDDDCDGLVDGADPSLSDGAMAYADADGDGWGDDVTGHLECGVPSGMVAIGGDCDDTQWATNPAGVEVCDVFDSDEDCDGGADDADPDGPPASAGTWYTDADADGFGTGGGVRACLRPSGTSPASGDCNDAVRTVFPGAPEVCDGSADDCANTSWTSDAGIVTFFPDSGGSQDLTSTFASGASGSPATWRPLADGGLSACAGVYYVLVDVDHPQVIDVVGLGAVTLSAGNAGPVVYAVGASVALRDVTLTGGTGHASGSTYGGGVAAYGSAIVLDGVLVSANTATYGGGVYLDATSSLATNDTLVEDNTATLDGGGVHTAGGSVDLSVYTELNRNHAGRAGGGIYANAAQIDGYLASVGTNDAPIGGGAALYAASILDLTSSVFHSNTAGQVAAMLLDHSDAVATDSQFHDNTTGGADIVRVDGGNFDCVSNSAGDISGIFSNVAASGASVRMMSNGSHLTSTACDWDVGFPRNAPIDVATPTKTYDFGDNATFACTGGTCR